MTGRLAVTRLGSASESAPLAVAVHGITAHHGAWLAVADALGDRAALLAVDLRGRGESRALGPPYGLDAHADDLLGLLDERGLLRPVLAGHSLGAYVVCRFAVRHPDRVARLVLVDGGLADPAAAEIEDPEGFIAETIGPAKARLEMEFQSVDAYRDWWAAHPAFAGSDVPDAVLDAYAARDLVGEPPHLHSGVDPAVIGADGVDLLRARDAAALPVEAVLLHAPAGLDGAPPPLLSDELVRDWALADPDRRRAVGVPGTNHYSIAMGVRGAELVADEIAAALSPVDGGPQLA